MVFSQSTSGGSLHYFHSNWEMFHQKIRDSKALVSYFGLFSSLRAVTVLTWTFRKCSRMWSHSLQKPQLNPSQKTPEKIERLKTGNSMLLRKAQLVFGFLTSAYLHLQAFCKIYNVCLSTPLTKVLEGQKEVLTSDALLQKGSLFRNISHKSISTSAWKAVYSPQVLSGGSRKYFTSFTL